MRVPRLITHFAVAQLTLHESMLQFRHSQRKLKHYRAAYTVTLVQHLQAPARHCSSRREARDE